jgi:CBS domain-containing membrane protein
MSRDVIKLHEDDDIHQALDKFKQVNLMSLPVVNAENQMMKYLKIFINIERNFLTR